jgi:hypothetical protein
MRFYNLGYPDFSLTKDALILSRAVRYQPDLVVWLVTLRSMPQLAQGEHALVRNNWQEICDTLPSLYVTTHSSDACQHENWSYRFTNLFSSRRDLADLVRLQLYGVMWGATGIDQHYPDTYEPLQKDFDKDDSFFKLQQPLNKKNLAFNNFQAAKRHVGNTPLIIVNEPMFISEGQNSDIRYNFFYPRWAYDQYRKLMPNIAAEQGWRYVDLWNIIPPGEFTNSAVHLSPTGSKMLAQRLAMEIK